MTKWINSLFSGTHFSLGSYDILLWFSSYVTGDSFSGSGLWGHFPSAFVETLSTSPRPLQFHLFLDLPFLLSSGQLSLLISQFIFHFLWKTFSKTGIGPASMGSWNTICILLIMAFMTLHSSFLFLQQGSPQARPSSAWLYLPLCHFLRQRKEELHLSVVERRLSSPPTG